MQQVGEIANHAMRKGQRGCAATVRLPKVCQNTLARYPTLTELCKAHNPDMQALAVSQPDRAYTSEKSLTMLNVDHTYGKGSAATWLLVHIADISEFAGCKEKMDAGQAVQTASLIVGRYSYLKMSELLLFFGKFKMGDYGKFYGAVDPMTIMAALKSFITERACSLQRIEAEKEKQKILESSKDNISYEEWQKIKQQKQQV